jgi:hypothetical protein
MTSCDLEKMEWKRVEVGLIAERLVVRRDRFDHDGDLDFDLRLMGKLRLTYLVCSQGRIANRGVLVT